MRIEASVRMLLIVFVLFTLLGVTNGAYAEDAAKEKAGEEAENEWDDKGEDKAEGEKGEEIAKDSIVVWHLAAQAGVSDEQTISISGLLTTEVEDISGRRVISEEDIQTILKGEEVKQNCGNQDTSCIAEIGSALGANEAISGDLGRVGKLWILNLRRINVREAKVMKRVSRKVKGSLERLIGALPSAVRELLGEKKKTKKEKPEEEAGFDYKSLIGVNMNLFLNPKWEWENIKVSAGGSSSEIDKEEGDCEFGYGATFGFGYYIVEYVAIGFDIDTNIWNADMGGGGFEYKVKFVQVAVDPTIRVAFHLGSEKQFELYGKLGIGYSMFIMDAPGKEICSSGVCMKADEILGTDPQHGWNVKILPGFKYNMGGFAIFVELGYYMAKYKADHDISVDAGSQKVDVNMKYDYTLSSFMLATGIGYQW